MNLDARERSGHGPARVWPRDFFAGGREDDAPADLWQAIVEVEAALRRYRAAGADWPDTRYRDLREAIDAHVDRKLALLAAVNASQDTPADQMQALLAALDNDLDASQDWRHLVLVTEMPVRRTDLRGLMRALLARHLADLRRSWRRAGCTYRGLTDAAVRGFAHLTAVWQFERRRSGVLTKRVRQLTGALLRRALALSYAASPSTPPGRLVVCSARVVRGPNPTDRTWTCPIGGGAAG
jgi:hypothetical protein